jgi:hypothetical protein
MPVVHLDDLGVGHRGDARDARAGEVRVGVVDDRVIPLARDSHLIHQNLRRPLWAHFPAPQVPDGSGKTLAMSATRGADGMTIRRFAGRASKCLDSTLSAHLRSAL